MKKHIGLISLLALSGLFANSSAIADPNIIEIGISCPDASGTGSNTLSNWGGRIAGYGRESINSVSMPIQPYFSIGTAGGHFPSRISDGHYASTSTQYDPTLGIVTCGYTSAAGFDPINVPYDLTNGAGGVIVTQTLSTIVIYQYIGLKNSVKG